MPEEVKPNATSSGGEGNANGGVNLPPGGIAGVDTESSDLDLLRRLTAKNDKQGEEDGSGGEGEEDEETAGEGEGAEGEGEEDGEATGGGEGDEGDSGGGEEDTFNAALEEIAKELGFDSLESLSEKQLETLKKLVKEKGSEEGEEDGDGGDGDDDDLTAYERELMGEEEGEGGEGKPKTGEEGKEGKDGKGAPDEGADDPAKIFSAILEGKVKLLYKDDADFHAKLSEAVETKDMEAYEVLQNQRFVERGMKFLLPAVRLLVDKQLDTFADLITPALSEYTRVSSQRSIATARDKAIGELESLTTKSGAKPYAGIKQFLTPEDQEKKVVINGKSVPSSPWTRVLKANPEILNIRVSGKDGKPDHTATFIAQYKAAMKFGKQTSTSTPVTKKVAEKLVSAGVKAGQRQERKHAGGKLNSNTSGGTGKQGSQKKNWAKEYAEIGNLTGAANWIGS